MFLLIFSNAELPKSESLSFDEALGTKESILGF